MMRLSIRRPIFLIAAGLLLSPAFAPAQNIEAMMVKASPGMSKEELLSLLGEPDSIPQKTFDAQKKLVEIWQYDPLRERGQGVNPAVGAPQSVGGAMGHLIPRPGESEEKKARKKLENPPYEVTIVDGVVETIRKTGSVADKKTEPVIVENEPVIVKEETPVAVKTEPPVTQPPVILPSVVLPPPATPVPAAAPAPKDARDTLTDIDQKLIKLGTEMKAFVQAGTLSDPEEKRLFDELVRQTSVMEASVASLAVVLSAPSGTPPADYASKVRDRFKEFKETLDVSHANQRFPELVDYTDRLGKAVTPLDPILTDLAGPPAPAAKGPALP